MSKALSVEFRDVKNESATRTGPIELTRLGGRMRIEDGSVFIEARNESFQGPGVGPGRMATGGFATNEKVFNPGLTGTNLIEIDLAGYTHEGEHVNCWLDTYHRSSAVEVPGDGKYEMGWSILIGSFTGQIGRRRAKEADRGVQVRFDRWSQRGLLAFVGRTLVPGDTEKYPLWDPRKVHLDDIVKGPFIDDSFLVLIVHSFAPTSLGLEGLRYGLGCTADGNELFWTLDGTVVDTVDISGFFGSSPEAAADDAHLSIVASSCYRENLWEFDSLGFSLSD